MGSALILNRESELFHKLNWSCDNGIYLAIGDHQFLITDGRYTTEARENIPQEVEVVESKDLIKKARELLLKYRVKKLTIDPTGWNPLQYRKLGEITTLQPVPNYSQKERICKTPEELEFIRQSAKENREAFKKFLEIVEPHWEEFELAYRFKEILTNRGRRELSFEPIVAVEENSAKPHARLTTRRLEPGEILLLDAGIKVAGYCSDRTRTISTDPENWERGLSDSKKQTFSDPLKQKVYNLVLEAQLRAIEGIKVGVPLKEIDKIARETISQGGFGDYFVHGLGHGVGIEIHELPIVNPRSPHRVEEGMVFTIEPGIYLPGKFGVRIEDMVIVTHSGEVEIV
ncbi:MAG: X-Pro aminopeptidase [Epsilonproteobacteria bacterium]|nr:X-Pro aminopeptidase [Campylobacterota bacterium]NPA89026.1 M24 family metallopeptidase [Campylobacterota bacterium]